MGQALLPERSPSAPLKIKPFLSLSDSDFGRNESNFEFSSADSSDNELPTNETAQNMWERESLIKFGQACALVSNDIEFYRLNNKLLVALKQFSTLNKVYCTKCKVMTQMTKRGKTKNTYQFACGSHTLSATQILGTLPDAFILEHIPLEPRNVFNETLSWLGKDQLSPELQARSTNRNALKRYSAHRSPIKAPMSSLLSSRNSVNEIYVELRNLEERVKLNEKEMKLLKEANNSLAETNSGLTEQIKLLKEENCVLKRHFHEPTHKPSPLKNIRNLQGLSYANVAEISKPMNKPMKFYTVASTNSPSSPMDVISPSSKSIPFSPPKTEFSPLKIVFFKGCYRKSIGTYKAMLPSIGFEPHWARHIVFLAEDIMQITTFESKADILIKAMQSISPDVKHLLDFDPLIGISYADYGKFTDESASKSYLSLMKQCASKLATDSQKTPSLRRISSFLTRIVEGKNINFQPAPRATRVFCLGDFILKKETAPSEMDVEIQEPSEIMPIEPSVKSLLKTGYTETEAEMDMNYTQSTINDQ